MPNGHGGKRKGAGRPKGSKTQKTIIREKAIAQAGADAEYALGLFTTWQQDETKSDGFRAMCAREVMDRVLGRPTQHKIVDKKRVWRVRFSDRDFSRIRDTSSHAAQQADGDMGEQSEAQSHSNGEAVGQDDPG